MAESERERWQRVSAHLDELLDLDAPASTQRLQQIRGDDPALADELQALLNDGEQARSERFLADMAARPWPPDLGVPLGDALSPNDGSPSGPQMGAATLVGQRLGAYILEAPIGEGGGGSVWRARRDDGRFVGEVAIKLLHLSLVANANAERFRREGAILGRLAHPNIARLMDAGVGPSGQPYLVLELVNGERIDRHCDTQQLNVEARLALFEQVLDAVSHAHRYLVVHRDIKPSNILVAADGRVRLLDFGIAKLMEAQSDLSQATELTREAGRPLTPEYAAPEQWNEGAISTATDVYALGMLLFELLAGVRPRRDGPRDAPGDAELLTQALAQLARNDAAALERIAVHRKSTPATLLRTLAGDLQNIVARAIAVEPGARYASVDALADDLRRYLTHQPVLARPLSISYRVAKFVRRHRGRVAAAAVLALAIAGGVAGTVSQAQRAAEQARVAGQERDRALRELTHAEAANEFIGFLLSEGGDKPFTSRELLARAERLVDRQFANDAPVRARLAATVADQYANLEELAHAEAATERALAAANVSGEPRFLAQLRCFKASLKTQAGQYDQALQLAETGLAELRALPGADGGLLSTCLNVRARVLLETGDAERALGEVEQAIAALGTPRPGQRLQAVNNRNVLADVQGRLGDYPRAIDSYESALEELADMGRDRTTVAAVIENNFGVILLNAGLLARAASVLEHTRETVTGVLGVAGINPLTDANLAGAWIELGRADEAARMLEGALVFSEQNNSPRLIAIISLKAAAAWCAAGNAARCAARLEQARKQLTAILPPGHSAFGTTELTIARLALLRDDQQSARRHLQQSIAIYDAAPERNPVAIVSRGVLARLEQRLGNTREALLHSARAVSDARDYVKGLPASEWLGSALLVHAVMQKASGDIVAARATAVESLAQLRVSLGDSAPATREAAALLDGS